MPEKTRPSGSRKGAGIALLGVAGGVGALAAANQLIARNVHDTYSVLSGESRRYPWAEGDIFYKVKGQGEPLVLLHGIYAGASAFEWRKNFDTLSDHFRVYAPDLLGFGLSSRPAIDYVAQTSIQLIIDFVREVAGGAEHPVHIIASSLSAAHVIQAAFQRPKLFERLALIEPTGIYALNDQPNPAQRLVHQLVRAPIIGTSIYNTIASRAGIKYYLKQQTYLHSEAITDDLVDYYYTTAHQPGAKNAVASFMTGYLNINIEESFAQLTTPALLVWGKEAKVTPVEDAHTFQRLNPRAKVEIIEGSCLLPQEEQANLFNQKVIQWLRQEAPTHA